MDPRLEITDQWLNNICLGRAGITSNQPWEKPKMSQLNALSTEASTIVHKLVDHESKGDNWITWFPTN